MLQFITRFPAEITLEIVSYLDQLDTIECMCVCRHWHNVIPGYALRVWNQVYVSWNSWDKTNDCMIQCLKHVQHLTIEDRDSRAILSKFKKSPLSRLGWWFCNGSIAYLIFFYCYLRDQSSRSVANNWPATYTLHWAVCQNIDGVIYHRSSIQLIARWSFGSLTQPDTSHILIWCWTIQAITVQSTS